MLAHLSCSSSVEMEDLNEVEMFVAYEKTKIRMSNGAVMTKIICISSFFLIKKSK